MNFLRQYFFICGIVAIFVTENAIMLPIMLHRDDPDGTTKKREADDKRGNNIALLKGCLFFIFRFLTFTAACNILCILLKTSQ